MPPDFNLPFVLSVFGAFLTSLFPDTDWSILGWAELAERLEAVICRPDTYLVYREDVPPGVDLRRVLADYFGAEPGDGAL